MAKTIKRIEADERGAIMVPGSAFNRIADIAEQEERDMGGQVAYIVKTLCDHPLEMREEVNMVVAFVHAPSKSRTARVGKDQPYRGFFCNKCGKYIFASPATADTALSVAEAMNAPLVGAAV